MDKTNMRNARDRLLAAGIDANDVGFMMYHFYTSPFKECIIDADESVKIIAHLYFTGKPIEKEDIRHLSEFFPIACIGLLKELEVKGFISRDDLIDQIYSKVFETIGEL